jgi:hypothetical protein
MKEFKNYKVELAARNLSVNDLFSTFKHNKKFDMKVGMFTQHIVTDFKNLKQKDIFIKEITDFYINEFDNFNAKIIVY